MPRSLAILWRRVSASLDNFSGAIARGASAHPGNGSTTLIRVNDPPFCSARFLAYSKAWSECSEKSIGTRMCFTVGLVAGARRFCTGFAGTREGSCLMRFSSLIRFRVIVFIFMPYVETFAELTNVGSTFFANQAADIAEAEE